jgi:hypothetical protein
MKTIKTISVQLNEDFIQALQEQSIEPQRAEIRTYDDKRTAIEIYIECAGFGRSDFDILDQWGLESSIVCGVGYEHLSIYHGDVTSDTIKKIVKEGGEG